MRGLTALIATATASDLSQGDGGLSDFRHFTNVLDGGSARVGAIAPERPHLPTSLFDRMWAS